MIVANIRRIIINPSKPSEYAWWMENKESMKKEGYELNEKSTVAFYAEKVDTMFCELGEEK